MKVLGTIDTLNKIKEKMESSRRMAYVRFGDGEILIMDNPERSEGFHRGSPEYQKELIDAFRIEHPDYLVALAAHSLEEGMGGSVFGAHSNEDFLKETARKLSSRDTYYNAIALHYLSLFQPRLFVDFVRSHIRTRKSAIIGGGHLIAAMEFFGSKLFLQTPGRDAFYEKKEWYPKLNEMLDREKPDILLCGVGSCSKTLIKDLWNEERELIMLDIGSVFDMIVGVNSRGWINESWSRIQDFRKACQDSAL